MAVVGATATGKSALALNLAEQLGGEVVNADASQLYRGMDVGTAKLPLDQRRGIAHHQVDVLSVTQEASVAAYQVAARDDLAAIRSRGRVPIVVGGSGLYVRALLDALDIPPTDATVRARFEAELAERGVAPLQALLRERDPEAAARIEPANARRIVRALEVIELTGRPFSASLPRREYAVPTVQLGLRAPRAALDQRVAERVHRMWAEGLVDEVRALEHLGLRQGRTASRAIGYAQVLAILEGAMGEQEAVEATIAATRRLVRRQESWFGADPRIVWLDHATPNLAKVAAACAVNAGAVNR